MVVTVCRKPHEMRDILHVGCGLKIITQQAYKEAQKLYIVWSSGKNR